MRESPVLRTRIVQVPGRGLVQVVLNQTINWRGGDAADLDAYLAADDAEEPMGLGTPLARFGMVPPASGLGEWHFILTIQIAKVHFSKAE